MTEGLFAQPSEALAAAPRELVSGGRYRGIPKLDATDLEMGGDGVVRRANGDIWWGSRARASRWAGKVADDYHLMRWKLHQTMVGLITDESLLLELVALANTDATDRDRDAMDALAERAQRAAKSDAGSSWGTAYHAVTELADLDRLRVIPERYRGMITSYLDALAAHEIAPVPEYQEAVVVCDRYGIAGRLDKIGKDPRGPECCELQLRVLDTKTQRQLWTFTEIAIQLSIYANADAIWLPEQGRFVGMPPVCKHYACVLWAPRDHPEREHGVDVYDLDIARGWEGVELGERVREFRNEGKKLGAFRELPAPVDAYAARTEAWAGRLTSAASLEELAELYRQANELGEWTEELQLMVPDLRKRFSQEIPSGPC